MIDRDLLEKRKQIPKKIAELSYLDKEKAIYFLRVWGERKAPISVLHEDLCSEIHSLNAIGV